MFRSVRVFPNIEIERESDPARSPSLPVNSSNTAALVNGAHVGFGSGADLTRCRPAKPLNRDYVRTRESRQPRNRAPMSWPTHLPTNLNTIVRRDQEQI